MKKFLYLIVLIGLLLNNTQELKAQLENNSNNLTIITAPGAYDDGFNIGVQYEHQWNLPYVGGELVLFPALNSIDYTHLIIRTGIGQEYGNPVGWKWRWNIGIRGGRVFRTGYNGPYSLLGPEIGGQLTLPFGLFGKLVYSFDTKTDSAIWGEDTHSVNSVWAGIGYRF